MSSCRLHFNEQPLDVPWSGHQQQSAWQRQSRTVCVACGRLQGPRGRQGGTGRTLCPALSELLPHGLISSSHPVTHTDKATAGVAPMRTHREEAGGPESRTQTRVGRLVCGPRQRQESRDQGAWSRQAALLDPTCLPGWDSQVRTRHLLGMRRAWGPPSHPSLPREGLRRPGTGGAQSRWAGSWDRVQGGLPTHAALQPQPGGRQSLEGSPGAHDGSGMCGLSQSRTRDAPPQGPGCDPTVPHSCPSGQASLPAQLGSG